MASSSSNSSSSSRVPLTIRDYFFQDPHFESAWEDFDKIRKDMMKESQDFWAKVKQDQPAALAAAPESGAGDLLSPLVIPKRWMLPRFLSRDESDKTFPADFFSAAGGKAGGGADDQVMRVVDEGDKFEVSLDTHEYRPDELKVSVEGGQLVVEAKHEEKGDGRFVSRQFRRSFALPEGCRAAAVASNLSSDGILVVTAPKKEAIEEKK